VKQRLLVSAIMAVGLAGLAHAQEAKPATPVAGPRIAVEPASFDFGAALTNKTLTKEFRIKNFGTTELVIENVSTTCGCTVGQLETKNIKPGQSVPLTVSLQTRESTGLLQRAVLVRSNDPTRALVEVKVQANVTAAPAAK